MNEQEAEGGHPNKKSQSLAQFLVLDQFSNHWLKILLALRKKHPTTPCQVFITMIPWTFSKGTHLHLFELLCLGASGVPHSLRTIKHMVRVNINTWRTEATSWLHYWNGIIFRPGNKWSYGRSLAHNGSIGFTNQLSAHLPNPKYIIEMYILHGWESFPFIVLGLWNKNYYREEVQVDIFETASPGQEIVSKTISQCQRMVEINNTLKDIKDARMVVPITPSFNLTLWPVETI